MRVAEYVHHDAVGLAKLVADGEVTAAELRTAALEAARAVNPRINAIVETRPPAYRLPGGEHARTEGNTAEG